MRLIQRGLLAAAVCFAGLAGSVGASLSQDFTWRLDTLVVESRPEAQGIARFVKRVFDKSDGRLKIDAYYGKALGINEPEELRAIKSGAVEMEALVASLYSRDAPAMSWILPNGVVLDKKEMAAVGPVLQSLLTPAFAEWDAVVVGWVYPPFHDISVVCKDPVNTLDQLKSKKLRVWAQEQVAAFHDLGVAAQIMSQNDLYVAMQTGVVDCALYGVPTIPTISLQEVSHYAAALHTFSAIPFALSVNKGVWEKLPDDLKAVVKEAGDWITKTTLDEAENNTLEADVGKQLEADGFKIFEDGFPKADRQAYFEVASKAWAEKAKELGAPLTDYRDAIVAKLKQVRASE